RGIKPAANSTATGSSLSLGMTKFGKNWPVRGSRGQLAPGQTSEKSAAGVEIGPLPLRQHRRDSDDVTLSLIGALVIAKEERLVFADRSAEGASMLVELEWGLGSACPVGEKLVRVHAFIAQEFEQRAMKLVCARLDHGIDEPAGIAPELRAELAGLHAEFL